MTHWMRMGSQFETTDEGIKGLGAWLQQSWLKGKAVATDVMEVGCFVTSNLVNHTHSV